MNETQIRQLAADLVEKLHGSESPDISRELTQMHPQERLALLNHMQELARQRETANSSLPKLEIVLAEVTPGTLELIDIRVRGNKIVDVYNPTEVTLTDTGENKRPAWETLTDLAIKAMFELESLKREHPLAPYNSVQADGSRLDTTVGKRREELAQFIDQGFEKARQVMDSDCPSWFADELTRLNRALETLNNFAGPQEQRNLLQSSQDDSRAPFPGLEVKLHGMTPEQIAFAHQNLTSTIEAKMKLVEANAAWLSLQGKHKECLRFLERSGCPYSKPEILDLVRKSQLAIRRKEIVKIDPVELLENLATARTGRSAATLAQAQDQIDEAIAQLKDASLRKRKDQIVERYMRQELPSEEARLEYECLSQLEETVPSLYFELARTQILDGDFKGARESLSQFINENPQVALANSTRYLNLSLLAESEGSRQDVFAFHDHMIEFQKLLGSPETKAETLEQELELAKSQASKLPMEAISKFISAHETNLETLKAASEMTVDASQRRALEKQINDNIEQLKNLKLLKHAPAHVELLKAIFAVASRKPQEANSILNQIELTDPEFATAFSAEMSKLKEAAAGPIHDTQTRLALEALYTSSALLVGAGVALITSLSGPAAMALGVAAGAATRTTLKYAFERNISWTDPLHGGLDGFAGAAGIRLALASKTMLDSSARVALKADAALKAAGYCPSAISASCAAERAHMAGEIAGAAYRSLASNTSRWTRLESLIRPTSEAARHLAQLRRANLSLSTSFGFNSIQSAFVGSMLTQHLSNAPDLLHQMRRDGAVLQPLLRYEQNNFSCSARLSAGGFLFGPAGTNVMSHWYDTAHNARRLNLQRLNYGLDARDSALTNEELRRNYAVLPGPKPQAITGR